MRKRTKQVIIRLNSEEYAMLQNKMEQTEFPYSALFRKFISDDNLPILQGEDAKALLANISKIGSNINQIARVANSTQTADATMMTSASMQIDRLWRLLKGLETWR